MILGIDTMLVAGGSMDTSFTTFLRTTRDQQLDQLIQAQHTQGFTPVPDTLKKSVVAFGLSPADGRSFSFMPTFNIHKSTADRGEIEMSHYSDSPVSASEEARGPDSEVDVTPSTQALIQREDSDLESNWRPSIDSDT